MSKSKTVKKDFLKNARRKLLGEYYSMMNSLGFLILFSPSSFIFIDITLTHSISPDHAIIGSFEANFACVCGTRKRLDIQEQKIMALGDLSES